MKVGVRLISKLDEMEKVEDSWNKVIRENSKSPFLFSGFSNQFFMQSNMSDFKLCGMDGFVPTFLIISVDDEIVGVSPVGIVDVGVRFCRFIPTDFQPDVVCGNNYREICLKHTVDFLFRKLRCQFVDFSLQASSPNLNLLKGLCRQLGIQVSMTAEAGHSILQVVGDWVDFEKSLGRDYRKLVRRIERRLSVSGPWKISWLGREDDESRVFDRIMEIERKSWKYAYWKQIGRNVDPSMVFYWNGSRQTALKESEFDWKVAILELDGREVAYCLLTKYKQSAYTCKTSFDERYRDIYPGIYVKHAVVRELFGRSDIKWIDFMGDLPYHRKWTDPPPPIVRLSMSKRSLVPILVRHWQSNKFFRKGLTGLTLISKKARLVQSALY
jgi:hypothetical protein